MPKTLPDIEIETSRKRLIALSIFALFCCVGGLLNLYPVLQGQAVSTFWAGGVLLFCFLFLLWSVLAAWVAWRAPRIAYRLGKEGLFLGTQTSPAFTWDQVRGATLVRGKRRSAVAVVLSQDQRLNTDGLMPDWLATFLGRPTDRDLALTNMDTTLDLATFLDLIGPYFHTYGPGTPKEI